MHALFLSEGFSPSLGQNQSFLVDTTSYFIGDSPGQTHYLY